MSILCNLTAVCCLRSTSKKKNLGESGEEAGQSCVIYLGFQAVVLLRITPSFAYAVPGKHTEKMEIEKEVKKVSFLCMCSLSRSDPGTP